MKKQKVTIAVYYMRQAVMNCRVKDEVIRKSFKKKIVVYLVLEDGVEFVWSQAEHSRQGK